jgi:TetR/AcrR family transcriptional regulator, transcriptional repressor for nem operon
MPYPKSHRDETRRKIIESARRLFNRHGFERVSVNQIMGDAGLTRGGFYGYFKSKSELYVESLSCFFTDPDWKNKWEGIDIDPNIPPLAPQIVRAYLSRQHLENVEGSCPMIALPGDVARGDAEIKRAFAKVFRAMVAFLEQDVRNRDLPSRTTIAQAIAALCVGGMVVARAVDDRGLADELRDASMAVALALGGWAEKLEQTPEAGGR